MMRAIHLHKKTILIIGLLSSVLIIWMFYIRRDFYIQRSLARRVKGLYAGGDYFYLNGKPIRILSGAMHYFRIVPEYWEDRLLKLKAMGLNTVETYVPWNLHEEIRGEFNFKGQLNVAKFLVTAHNLGLYVIIRPGPYICAEWDLGGLPSWLLKDPKMKLRSLYEPFMAATEKYFDQLIPRLVHLQYSNNGPIIAWQIENEYLSYGNDSAYMRRLQKEMVNRGVTEFLFTSDGFDQIKRSKDIYHLDNVLKTVNFQKDEEKNLNGLKEVQPNKPLMVMEFWSGWFDHWSEEHHILSLEKTVQRVTNILKLGASINFYMFHGGTNFGFMNGANADNGFYKPTITSYDYDAPLSEAGDMTYKYKALRKVMLNDAPADSVPEDMLKLNPSDSLKVTYDPVEMQDYIDIKTLLKYSKSVNVQYPVPMEELPINNHGGQSFGYILYQTKIHQDAKKLKITSYRDRAQVYFNSQEQHIPEVMDLEKRYIDERKTKNVEISLSAEKTGDKQGWLEILVENMGRVNFGLDITNQRKGILGEVFVDNQKHKSWMVYSLDFKPDFMNSLIYDKKWNHVPHNKHPGAGMYKGYFEVTGKPKDTYVLLSGWGKGVCFINGHNLGRYWKIGPQQTLYLPAPWIKTGVNNVVLFDQEGPSSPDVEITFVTEPQLGIKLQDRH
ncbi:beta-galactosidase-1-like protein 2 [Exaiptasia diaphana]|uniref:Beta-galactosidase n=1 Tax=Exaiptasia diaphana TaxID=2652724 RepID=A0A913XGX6_EXADI|nr:beta-galactosidase-1-like protein 2 [Exaiptasia diaphana]KXJ20417.1 Beta-galactosidase-1-like protein 2 [Exaiptasia diaphana]